MPFTTGETRVGYRNATTYTINVKLANGQWATIAACYGWPGEDRAVDAKANAELFARAGALHAALVRAVPWLGKLIADGAHLNSVLPRDAVGALEQAEAALAQLDARRAADQASTIEYVISFVDDPDLYQATFGGVTRDRYHARVFTPEERDAGHPLREGECWVRRNVSIHEERINREAD